MTTATTPKYRLPYPLDNEPVRNLPDILRTQAQDIETALSGFDYDGTDQNTLTSRVTSLETLLNSIRNNTVTLFDNDNNAFTGIVTLSETAANFDVLEICYKSNDGVYSSTRVANPDQKLIVLTSSYFNPTGANNLWLKSRTVKITGKTINTYQMQSGWTVGESIVNGSNNANPMDTVTITQVYGTRKMQII